MHRRPLLQTPNTVFHFVGSRDSLQPRFKTFQQFWGELLATRQLEHDSKMSREIKRICANGEGHNSNVSGTKKRTCDRCTIRFSKAVEMEGTCNNKSDGHRRPRVNGALRLGRKHWRPEMVHPPLVSPRKIPTSTTICHFHCCVSIRDKRRPWRWYRDRRCDQQTSSRG